jgi:hypothetical protein
MKPLSQWSERELQFLIDNKLPEIIDREYKETIVIGSPSDKKEVCKDVSAMANSQGGVIIFGLKESKKENMGSIAERLTPITDRSLKEIAQQVIVDGVKPRMEFRFYPIPSSDGSGEYVLLEIHKSLRGLHMVTWGADNRYYIRRDFQSLPMTAFEIEEAYRNYALADERIESQLRRFKLTNPNVNLESPANAWMAFTVIPRFPVKDLFVPICSRPRHEIPEKAKGLRTRDGLLGTDSFQPNYHGMLSAWNGEHGAEYKHQIFRDGAVYLGRRLNVINRKEKKIFPLSLVGNFHDFVSLAAGLFLDADYLGPLRVHVELEQIRYFELGVPDDVVSNNQTFRAESFKHSVDATVRDAIERSSVVFEEVHHHLWQSFGYSRCELYRLGEGGEYVDRVLQNLQFVND